MLVEFGDFFSCFCQCVNVRVVWKDELVAVAAVWWRSQGRLEPSEFLWRTRTFFSTLLLINGRKTFVIFSEQRNDGCLKLVIELCVLKSADFE